MNLVNHFGRRAMDIPFDQRVTCTIEEALQATGLGRTKLYEQIAEGRVLTTSVGRRRLVIVRSLKELLDPTSVPAPREAVSNTGGPSGSPDGTALHLLMR